MSKMDRMSELLFDEGEDLGEWESEQEFYSLLSEYLNAKAGEEKEP
jgi:hypothetical protein